MRGQRARFRGSATRRLLNWGPRIVVISLLGAIVCALPLLGIGGDASPDGDTYLERRYGNIGLGLAVLWLTLMAALFTAGVAMTIARSGFRRRRE